MGDIDYTFHYPDGNTNHIIVKTDPETQEIVVAKGYNPPDWALLENNRCKNCTLNGNETDYCPIAKNISYLFSDLSLKDSYEEVKLEVSKNNTQYSSTTTMQRALSSLLGLICSLSPCPKTRFLKPMGIFHLPFSSELDTLSRTFSFYMLRKYFELNDHKIDFIDTNDLVDDYKNLRTMNQCFARRLRTVNSSDAPVNAIILLDLLAQFIDFEIEEQLGELKVLFQV